MGRHAGRSLDGPYLGFAIESAAEEVLSGVTPVERRDPRTVASQVAHMLAVLRVVDGDNTRISRSG